MEFYQTQYGLLGSRSLAEAVMKNLRLADDQAFLEATGLDKTIESKGLENDRGAREDEVVKVLLKNVNVSPIRLSRLVNLSYVSSDPQMSARIANSWAAMYMQSNIERRFNSTAYARQFLEERLNELRQKLEASERQAVTYASNQSIINLPSTGGTQGDASQSRSLVSDSLADLNTALAKATAERIAAEARLSGSGAGASSEALDNVAIGGMREQLAESEADYARMLTEFTPQYPAAVALKARIDELRKSISREEGRVSSSITNAYRDARARESKLREQVESLKGSFNDQRSRSIQYNIYQREADTNRQLYDALLQRYKEIGAAAGVATNNVSIVDPAVPPDRPSSPRPLLNLILALFGGLGLGIILALVRDQFDEAISDPSDVEKVFGLPLLGVIPKVDEADRVSEVRDPKSGVAEAYISLENRLSFSTDHGVPRALTVTSTGPAEGKSTTAFAIAYWLARNGARTLMIDADMRSPSLHEMLGEANGAGLSNVLSGGQQLAEVIHQSDVAGFDYVFAGPQPPNAANLLLGKGLKELVADALTRYEHVVIDSPPVMGLADAPIIGSAVDGTIFVVEAQRVKTRLAVRAVERLQGAQTPLLGVVLSKFDAAKSDVGYDYGYGYGHGTRYGVSEEAR
jgi:capsular exopolysaccharide synthesis family protein